MSKSYVASLFVSILVLAGCTDPYDNHWTELRQFQQKPLSSAQIEATFKGRRIKFDRYPDRVYAVSNDFVLQPMGENDLRDVPFQLLKNGIVCNVINEKRFCYRVFLKGDGFRLVYSNGQTFLAGKFLNES